MLHHLISVFGGGSSLQLFRIVGFRVGVHPSWFLILFLWICWLQDSFDDAIVSDEPGLHRRRASPRSLFFGSIVLHELGHAFAARREGIGVAGIDLFFFGGFMRADARQRDARRGVPRRRRRPGGDAAAGGRGFGVVGVAMLGRTRLVDAATLRAARRAAWSRCSSPSPRSMNVVAARVQPDPRVPARRRPDRPRGRLAAHRRPPQRDARLAPTSARRFAVLLIGYGVYRLLGDGDRASGLWYVVLGWMLGGAARAAVAAEHVRRPGSRASPRRTSWTPSR